MLSEADKKEIKELKGDRELLVHMKSVEKQSCREAICNYDRKISQIDHKLKELEK